MTVLRVLYLGDSSPESTAYHRAAALRRLGMAVTQVDPYRLAHRSLAGIRGALHYRTGYRFLAGTVATKLSQHADLQQFDVCWVDGGELISGALVSKFMETVPHTVLFNHDDPTGSRDRMRFFTLRRAISRYSLCVVVRSFNADEFRALGAKAVLRVWMSYDEVAHAPVLRDSPPPARLRSDVAFLGRNMKGEGRDGLIAQLIRRGINVAVWGDNWQSSDHWRVIEPHFRGRSVAGQDYVDAIRGAKVCLGMLSKGNRDQHTTRSMEIPYAGGVLCAQRTAEHECLYDDGTEAVFWDDAEECLAQCQRLLADDAFRERVRTAGYRRVLRNRVGNEDLCRAALTQLGIPVEVRNGR